MSPPNVQNAELHKVSAAPGVTHLITPLVLIVSFQQTHTLKTTNNIGKKSGSSFFCMNSTHTSKIHTLKCLNIHSQFCFWSLRSRFLDFVTRSKMCVHFNLGILLHKVRQCGWSSCRWIMAHLIDMWNESVNTTSYTYCCTHLSVLLFRNIPGGQVQPSTQSPLHVSGMESAWQVLPQVDTQALYSFVSSHERATQMKQSSHITSQKHKKWIWNRFHPVHWTCN